LQKNASAVSFQPHCCVMFSAIYRILLCRSRLRSKSEEVSADSAVHQLPSKVLEGHLTAPLQCCRSCESLACHRVVHAAVAWTLASLPAFLRPVLRQAPEMEAYTMLNIRNAETPIFFSAKLCWQPYQLPSPERFLV
jgi:hypothetical protein